jgi:hypothetical protein
MSRTLDWKLRHDPKSLNYKIDKLSPLKERSRTWKRTIWLDQGQEGACTGFGLSHVLGTTPKRRLGVDDAFAQRMYHEAQKLDEWPGEDYEGSSVLGAMKAAKNDGLISAYSWATTMEELIHAVGYFGPVECGINWYTGMFDTDDAGMIHVTGKIEGGHAICIGGVNVSTGTFCLYNSWGKDWGFKGNAKISFADMARLMSEQGEFALPKKV